MTRELNDLLTRASELGVEIDPTNADTLARAQMDLLILARDAADVAVRLRMEIELAQNRAILSAVGK